MLLFPLPLHILHPSSALIPPGSTSPSYLSKYKYHSVLDARPILRTWTTLDANRHHVINYETGVPVKLCSRDVGMETYHHSSTVGVW